jgi:hypothetical protein
MSNEHQDFEVYRGKSFAGICEDIVRNSEDKKNQVDILISDLKGLIKTTADAMMIIPLLKEYYDIGIRNDEQLIKLAAIIQRIISGKTAEGEGTGSLLTDDEKKQLMAVVDSTVAEVKAKAIPVSKDSPPKEKK